MIPVVKGDILTAKEDIIVHQVNTLGKMGKGLAKKIVERYPQVKKAYLEAIEIYKLEGKSLMGKVLICPTYDGTIVANIFAQETIQKKNQAIQTHTDSEALIEGLKKVLEFATSKGNHYTIAIPTYIGCGLANGDWDEIKPLIDEVFFEHENVATYYHYR